MRTSQDITGLGFVAHDDGVTYAGLLVSDSGGWSLSPPAGRSPGLLMRALTAGLPQVSDIGSELLTSSPARGWLAVVDRLTGRCSISGPSQPGFVRDLELDLPGEGLDTAIRARRLVLLVTTEPWAEPIEDLGGLLDQLAHRGDLAGAVIRAVKPGDPEEQTDPEHDGPGAIIVPFDSTAFFMELAEFVHDNVVSMAAAKRRAVAFADWRPPGTDAPLFGDEDAMRLLEPRLSHEEQQPYIYFYARLITEVADARGGPDGCPFWLPAVMLTAQAGVATLSTAGEAAVFDDVAALLGRAVTLLSAGGPSGALSEVLISAARLRIAMVEPDGLTGDRYAAERLLTYREAQRYWRAHQERLAHPEWPPPQPDIVKRELAVASDLAHRALDGSTGGIRARALITVVEAAVLRDPTAAGDAQAISYATEAWKCLDHSTDPVSWLSLLRILAGFAPETVRDQARTVFSLPLGAFLERYGEAEAGAALSQGIELALALPDRDLLGLLLDWGSPLPEPVSDAHARQLWEARLHCLPGDPTTCPHQVDHVKTQRQYERRARREGWTPEQRAMARLHLAAHARAAGLGGWGLRLLTEVPNSPQFWHSYCLLLADLHYVTDTPTDDIPYAPAHLGPAASDYAAIGLYPLAALCLALLQDHLRLPDGENLHVVLRMTATIAPRVYSILDPDVGLALRRLTHAAAARAHTVGAPMAIHLALHESVKGAEMSAWYGAASPLTLTEAISLQLARLSALGETWDDPDLDEAHQPDRVPYLSAAELAPGQTDSQIERNLRRHIDNMINHALAEAIMANPRTGRSFEDPLQVLDDDAVLVSWLVPAAPGWENVLIVLAFSQGGERAGTITVSQSPDRGHVIDDEVALVRAEVMADPLFRHVTPRGEELLSRPDRLLPTAWLDEWKQQGRTRFYLWPHGSLHYLPLHLYTYDGAPLTDTFTFTTIPALSVLDPAADHRARPPRVLVLASAAGGEPFGLAREDTLEEHAVEVARDLGATPIVGPEATRERLLAELAVADVVHIAAHGSQDLAAPWSHCLYLSATEDDDGRVFAYDILSVDLRGVRLVTLASCESGLGRFDVNDNLRGLPAALLLAGAQAVVACLWPVDPDSATRFFAVLHRLIAGGAAIEPAFRSAQRETRERFHQYRHWGAFILLGGRGVNRGGNTR